MDHGTMSCFMFGLMKATQPQHKIRARCVHCVVRNAPPLQFVVSSRSITMQNVLTPQLWDVRHSTSNMHC